MAYILKIKDLDGNWVDIPAIVGPKGEPGDVSAAQLEGRLEDFVLKTQLEEQLVDYTTEEAVDAKLTAKLPVHHINAVATVADTSEEAAQCMTWYNALGNRQAGRYVLITNGQYRFVDIYRATENYGVIMLTFYSATGANISYASVRNGSLDAFVKMSLDGHAHDDRYYTEEEVDEKIANIGTGGSAGMLREFDSGALAQSTYVYNGTKSKLYTVSVLSTSNIKYTCVIDYKHAKNGGPFYTPFGGITVSFTSSTVTFNIAGNSGTLFQICGYY
ncbi:MAG: hypothetical protein E7462_06605 [Ruminococcaceae bacterium]|nr:hypothetical protein [Oscillospiraceae bacterium]